MESKAFVLFPKPPAAFLRLADQMTGAADCLHIHLPEVDTIIECLPCHAVKEMTPPTAAQEVGRLHPNIQHNCHQVFTDASP